MGRGKCHRNDLVHIWNGGQLDSQPTPSLHLPGVLGKSLCASGPRPFRLSPWPSEAWRRDESMGSFPAVKA